jgi:hypothetical protein
MNFFDIINSTGKGNSNPGPAEYEFCAVTKAYLKALAEKAGLDGSLSPNPATLSLMKSVGYAKFSKFLIHVKDWLNLTRPMPLLFFKAIGGDLALIDEALELDRAEFSTALARCPVPKIFVSRAISCVYVRSQFPPEIKTEAEAVAYLRQVCIESQRISWISFPGIKLISCDPTGSVGETVYTPGVTVTRHTLSFRGDWADLGTVRIG